MKYFFGVDLNSRKVLCILMDETGNILDRQEMYAEVYRGPDYVVGRLCDTINLMIKKHHLSQLAVAGIGIALPSTQSDTDVSPLHFASLKGANLPERLYEAMNIPVSLVCYGVATGLAETWHDQSASIHSLLTVDVFETLISASLIVGGENCLTPDVGHMIADHCGFECSCGRRGCLNVMGTGNAAIRYYEEFTKHRIGMEELKRRLQSRDSLAVRAFDRCAQYISICIVNVISICAPDKVCLGGDFILDNEHLAAEVIRQVRANTNPTIDITLSHIPKVSEAFGAGIMALMSDSKN